MKAEDLLELIGEAPEEELALAESARKRPARWVKWTALAACAAVAVGLGAGMLTGNIKGFSFGASTGGGSREGRTYMAYYGPVLPLTVMEEAPAGITAERAVDYDFSPYEPIPRSYEDMGKTYTYTQRRSEAVVTDSYVLTNRTDKDVTFTALYPYLAALSDEEPYHAALSVNGEQVESAPFAGPYTGGFTGVWGDKDQDKGSLNLRDLNSFAGYAALLANGRYQASAFDEFPDLTTIPCVVYKLHDFQYSANTDAVNPTLRMDFNVDYSRTAILTYNMNQASNDLKNGRASRGTGDLKLHPNASAPWREPRPAYLILVGEDIEGYTLQGYVTGGYNTKETLDDLSCTVTRYETDLGTVLRELLDTQWFAAAESEGEAPPGAEWVDAFYNYAAELLVQYGPLGEETRERYWDGMLENIFSETGNHRRVFYARFDVTVPAGGRVEVTAVQTKRASMDFVGKHQNRNGYDLATRLGSHLTFTVQRASVSSTGYIELLDNNFGFDLEAGVTEVTLDPAEEHYWMDVKCREE